ncbi:MAG: ATP-binding protein [Polyangiaceae bacterium]|jgi:predicted kinase
MPIVHLICGATGAGKTSYATTLAERLHAVRFTLDEWMALLFLPDRPELPSLAWAVERTARCEAQIWAIVSQLSARGVDAVLDLGFSRQDHRDEARIRALQAGAIPKLHYLDVEPDTRRSRVQERNSRSAGVYEVTDAMFDWMDQAFEVPTDDELVDAMIIGD